MSYVKGFKNFISEYLFTESLSIKTAKKYSSIKRSSEVEQRLNSIFDKISKLPGAEVSRNGHRIYFSVDKTKRSEARVKSDLEKEVEKVLDGTPYTLIDYDEGTVSDDKNRTLKLQKVLNKLGEIDLMNRVNRDNTRIKNKDKLVVFCKHPYDIAGMTSGRGWENYSCMNLETGCKKEIVQQDIKEGTVVAYLIEPNDKNIEHPSARILLKPYHNTFDPTEMIYLNDRHYGTLADPGPFYNEVEKICQEISKESAPGSYSLNQKLSNETGFGEKTFFPISLPKTIKHVNIAAKYLGLINYSINDDLTVDVDETVDISNKELTIIPLKFGVVKGNFNCSGNKLTSLEGSPKKITGSFACAENNLMSLKGGPLEVDGSYACMVNKLKDLDGVAKIGQSINCSNNPITTLKHLQKIINGKMVCIQSKLKSLKDGPSEVKEELVCDALSPEETQWAENNIKTAEILWY